MPAATKAKRKKATAAKKTVAKKAPVRKAAAKKAPAKKVTAKKVTAKKTTTKKAPAKKREASAIKDAFTKSQIMTELAERTELSKKQVVTVFEELNTLIHRHVKSRGAGMFTLPGLVKMTVVKKPATKARKGINPFTGEETTFKAKPARKVIKVRALKKLKDMAE